MEQSRQISFVSLTSALIVPKDNISCISSAIQNRDFMLHIFLCNFPNIDRKV
jgi:hypothetical protein